MLTRYLLPLNGLLQSADEARDRRQWSAAALLYSRYLARKPDDAPIWVQLGHAEKERGNVGAAKEAYERARELTPDDIEVHLHIGLLFHEIGQNAAASAAYDRASQLDTKGAEPHTVRAMADLARNLLHWQAAGTHYRTYLLSEPQNAPIWLQLGHAEKEIGNLRSAWDAYEHAATLSPEDAEVHLQIGHVLRRMNENAMALQAYCNALQIDRTVFDAEATRSVGDLARDLRKWDVAVHLYEAYLRAAPDDGPLWVQLGHARKEIGDIPGARQAYEQALRHAPDNGDSHVHLASLLRLNGDTEAALDHYAVASANYRMYLQRKPLDASVWIELGHAERESGNLSLAWDAYDHAVTLSPNDAKVHLQIGHVLRRMDDPAAALQAYRNAFQINPTIFGAETIRSVGDLASSLRKWEFAAECYSSYLETTPDDGAIWMQLGEVRRETGDFSGARYAYEQMLKYAPDNINGHVHLARLLSLNGEGEAAFDHQAAASAHYRMYLQRKPLDASVWIELGHAERDSGKLSLAWDAYEHAVTLSPDDAKVHLQIGHVLRRMDDPAAALRAYRETFEIDPTLFDAEAIRSVGDLARRLRKWEVADEWYDAYLQMARHDGPVWVILGDLRAEIGNSPGARYAYEQALNFAPDCIDGRTHLANLLKGNGETEAALYHFEAARAHYRMYLQRSPRDAAVWVAVGHVEKEIGNLQSAWEAYEQAATLSPDDAVLHLHIGDVLGLMNENAAALVAYCKALEMKPTVFDAGTMRSVGDLARSLRNWEVADKWYGVYLQTAPHDGPAWVLLGDARAEIGKIQGARYAYEQALKFAPDCIDGYTHLASLLKRSGETKAALDHYEAARQLDPTFPGIDQEIEFLCLMVPGRGPRIEDNIRQALTSHFDADFYLRTNPDVANLAIEPISHYHFYGWREKRNPSRRFNTAYYLATNEDVAAANMNPLLHWVWAGRAEGRLPMRELDVERGRLETMRDPRSLIPDWAGAANNADPMRRGALRALLRDCAALVVSVSHDDYARNPGGVQNLIGDEQSHCVKKGWSYLHISPAAPIPVLADEGSKFGGRLSIRLDGVHYGIVTGLELALDLGELRDEGVSIVVTVHHLMGHAPENLLNVIRAAGDAPVSMWVHDFFTICPSYTLMRNDVKFCGGPPIESGACSICCYRGERERHQARISALFAAVNPRVTAPSQGTLDLWVAASALRHQAAQVEPLVSLFLGAPTVARLARAGSRRLRVAHLGARVYHKGWHVFEDLAMQLEDDNRYEFLQLGKAEGPLLPGSIRHVPVNVTPERRNAMVEAIATSEIDIVVMWAVWPETFSYTTHEALAGGAFVVAYREAGNVWPAVQLNARNQGCAVDDRNELLALFHGKELAKRAMQPRARGAVIPENWLADRLPQLADIQSELTGAVLIGGGT